MVRTHGAGSESWLDLFRERGALLEGQHHEPAVVEVQLLGLPQAPAAQLQDGLGAALDPRRMHRVELRLDLSLCGGRYEQEE